MDSVRVALTMAVAVFLYPSQHCRPSSCVTRRRLGDDRDITALDFVKQRVVGAYERSCNAHLPIALSLHLLCLIYASLG